LEDFKLKSKKVLALLFSVILTASLALPLSAESYIVNEDVLLCCDYHVDDDFNSISPRIEPRSTRCTHHPLAHSWGSWSRWEPWGSVQHSALCGQRPGHAVCSSPQIRWRFCTRSGCFGEEIERMVVMVPCV